MKDDTNTYLVELIDGLLLGDGCISADNRFSMGQSQSRMDWIDQIIKEFHLNGISLKKSYQSEGIAIIKGKTYHRAATVYIRSRRSKFMKEQRARWYPNGIKTVPKDINLTTRSLAHWACGDGYRGGKGYHFTFCTDSFADSDRLFLIERLRNEFGMELVDIPSRKRISITKNQDRFAFKNMMEQHFPSSCMYKLDLKINQRKLSGNELMDRELKLEKRRMRYRLNRQNPIIVEKQRESSRRWHRKIKTKVCQTDHSVPI